MALLIPSAGDPREITPANGRTFELHELQQLVGGYIEALRTQAGLWLFLNEDGKGRQLPLNPTATRLMAWRLALEDYIVGDCVLCSPLEAGADDADDAHEPDEAAPEAGS